MAQPGAAMKIALREYLRAVDDAGAAAFWAKLFEALLVIPGVRYFKGG